MKKFWVFLVLAATTGTATAWAINYARFGHRASFFGPFSMGDASVTPENAMSIVQNFSAKRAKVELEGEEFYDFGMMAPGSEGEHAFVIKNVGDDDLRLRLGATTCKCTLGDLDREVLAPGEQTEIRLSWTVKEGETDFAQSAQVLTNDPSRVAITLEIIGKVIREIDIVPSTWSFGEVATGEPFVIEGTIYSFLETDITPTELKFTSEELTRLADIEVEPFLPTEQADGIRSVARQGFRVTARVKPGLRQGAISQNLSFGFRRVGEDGELLPPPDGDEEDPSEYLFASVKGSIVGPLSMIPNSRLSGNADSGFIYDFGKIGPDDELTAKTFVVLKGKERDNTKLSIGDVSPANVVRATLAEPVGRGSMSLYALEVELIPGSELIERLGRNGGDYGAIWIESDNPKVSKMRVALKFSIEAR